MRPSIIVLILVLAALAALCLTAPAHAYAPRYSPSEIAVDHSGNVYVLMNMDSSTGEGLFVYAANGTLIKSVRRTGCSDIAIDDSGTVYVVNPVQKQVERWEKNGSFSVVWREDAPGRFINYFTIDRDNNLLVSDFNYSNAEIKVFDGCIRKINRQGEVIGVIRGSPAQSLDKVFRLSAGDNGTVYLTNFTGNFSAIYPDGSQSIFALASADNGKSSQVVTVQAGSDGYLYVGEMSDGRVRKLTTDGTPVAQWDGCGPDRFVSPVSIVADRDGRVFVSDMQNQRIVWFDSNGYRFGDNMTENLAGKGVLWDSAIAGDNYTTVVNITDSGTGGYHWLPDTGTIALLIGIGLAGAVLYLRRKRDG